MTPVEMTPARLHAQRQRILTALLAAQSNELRDSKLIAELDEIEEALREFDE